MMSRQRCVNCGRHGATNVNELVVGDVMLREPLLSRAVQPLWPRLLDPFYTCCDVTGCIAARRARRELERGPEGTRGGGDAGTL